MMATLVFNELMKAKPQSPFRKCYFSQLFPNTFIEWRYFYYKQNGYTRENKKVPKTLPLKSEVKHAPNRMKRAAKIKGKERHKRVGRHIKLFA